MNTRWRAVMVSSYILSLRPHIVHYLTTHIDGCCEGVL